MEKELRERLWLIRNEISQQVFNFNNLIKIVDRMIPTDAECGKFTKMTKEMIMEELKTCQNIIREENDKFRKIVG